MEDFFGNFGSTPGKGMQNVETGGNLISGWFAMKNAYDNAKIIKKNYQEQVDLREESGDELMGLQTVQFLKSGIDITGTGSPTDILRETKETAEQDMMVLKKQGEAKAEELISEGRGAFIKGVVNTVAKVAGV